jgi:arylsulfatase A-like enzyme
VRWFRAFPALLLILGCGGAPEDSAPSRPCILLVTVDTLRADALGCYGNATARTPRLDRLAAEGVRFTEVWTVCPLTLPAHATILTGLLPPEHGLRDNDPPSPLPPPDRRDYATLAEELGGGGYATAAFVSASVVAARTGLDQGFEVYDGPEEGVPGALRYSERTGRDTVRLAAEWIRDAGEPFFCWVHLFDPHDPYDPPEPFGTAAPPTSAEAYAAEVAYADHCVGILLDELARAGREEHTLVVVTSDHGEGLGEHGEPTHGYLLYETTLCVPLILRWPGRLAEAGARPGTRTLADLYSTLLRAAGRPTDRSLLEDEPGTVLSETLYGYRHMGWAQLFAARNGDRKLLRGASARSFDLATDSGETAPLSETPPDLVAAVNRYRVLPPRGEPVGPPPELPAGFPYAAGLGRHRIENLSWEENAKLRPPDPGFAAEIDRVKARIGMAPPREVEEAFAELAARDSGNPTLWFWRGYNAMRGGLDREAALAFEKAFRLGLTDAKVLTLWLRELLVVGDLAQAKEVIRSRLSEIVPDTDTWLMVGAYFLTAGDIAEAKRYRDLAERIARTSRERDHVSRFRHDIESRERHNPWPENDK